MQTIIRFFILALILVGSGVFSSCEKETYEVTQVNTFDPQDLAALQAQIATLQSTVDANQQISTTQWNQTMAALGTIGQQLAVLVANGNATQADLQTLIGLVNTLTGLTQGNTALLNQMWATIQAMNLDFATMQALLQSYGQTLLAMQAQLNGIGADISGINTQLALIYNQLLAQAAVNGQILTTVQGNSLFLQQLVAAVGGLNDMIQLVLNNQAAHGATLAVIAAGQVNIGNGIQQVLAGIATLNANDATQTALLNQFLPALTALGVNVNQQAATILAGIQALQLGQSNQNIVLGQLLACCNDQNAMLVLILDKLDDLAQTQADQGALLATLIANSVNQATTSQTILNNLIAQGQTQAQMFGMLTGIANQLTALNSSLDAWGTTIIAKLDQLQLSIDQMGTLTGQILANTQNIQAMNLQIINKIDDVIADLADLQIFIAAEIASVKAEIANVQTSLAVLTAKVDAIALQVATFQVTTQTNFALVISMLEDLDDNLCCNTCNGGNAPSVTNVWNNIYQDMSTNIVNHTVDNSTNLTFQQYYYAAQNGVGVANGGGFGGMNGCQVMAPVVILATNGSQNNVGSNNYAWGDINQDILDYDVANNCNW